MEEEDDDDSDPAWTAAAGVAAAQLEAATEAERFLCGLPAAAAPPAVVTAGEAAAAATAATVGAAGTPLHPQLLEALNGVKAQLFVHSESVKEINRRGPAHGSPKAGHDEVRDVFKELLAGQRDQNQKTV